MTHARSSFYNALLHPMNNARSGKYPLAKIALSRHTFLYNDEAQVILVMDIHDHVFYIRCTPAEYAILRQLLGMPNEVVPFEQLTNQFLAHFEYRRDIQSLRRHVSRLKRKLPTQLVIVSVREAGYFLQEQI